MLSIDRRHLLRLSAAGALAGHSLPGLALGMGHARAAAALKAEPLTIAVGGQGLLYHLPLVIAQQLRYFEAEGLAVRVDDYAGGSQALHALLRGTADICAGAYEHTLISQELGQFLRAFVVQGRSPQMALGVSTRWMPRYQQLSDLRGKRIGVSSLGASTALTAQLLLLSHGVDWSAVQLVAVGSGAQAMDALRTGRVHALCHADPLISILESKGAVRVVCDLRTAKDSLALYGGNMPSGTLYAPQAFLQKNPARAQAVAHAMVRALKWLQTAAPVDVLKVVPSSYLLGARKAYLAAFEHMRASISPDGLMPEDGPRTALRVLSRLSSSLARGSVSLERTYTNEFVRKAKQRYHV